MNKEEFKNSAPLLSKIKKTSCFKVPDGYFENLDDHLYHLARIGASDNSKNSFEIPANYFDTLEEITTRKLISEAMNEAASVHKSVPEGYFEALEDKIINKLDKSTPKVRSLRHKIMRIAVPIGVAASLFIAVLLNQNSKEFGIDALSTTEIEAWFATEYATIEDYSYLASLSDEDLENVDFDLNFTEDEMLDYLSDEDIQVFLLDN